MMLRCALNFYCQCFGSETVGENAIVNVDENKCVEGEFHIFVIILLTFLPIPSSYRLTDKA